ncbi:hypothetical protein RND81_11G064000 [Saponaria officinalis]|uniref:Uncharacterized protein n=1 Tax=Saponaria officinalis TaxID=3572 RepID=A0AAW1HII0_SAPOF
MGDTFKNTLSPLANSIAKYADKHRQLEEQGQPIDDNQLLHDIVGGHRKGHVYGVGSAVPLYYETTSKVRTSHKHSSYVSGIMSPMEEYRKFQEETINRQEEMQQKLANLQALIQTQTCSPNPNVFPNRDHNNSDGGVGGAGMGLQV